MQRIRYMLIYLLLFVWLLAVVLPILWVFLNATRSSQEFVQNPFGIPWFITGAPEGFELGNPIAVNFQKAWVDNHFSQYLVNSIIVTVFSLIGILAIGSMAAYILARFTFKGVRPLFFFFISGMMLPAQLVLVPLFFQYARFSDWGSYLLEPFGLELQLHDSLSGLVFIYIALSLPFTILVLTGFFKTLPNEMRESAIMDGCNEYQVFWHIMLPLARPGMVTAAIFNFIGIWNEYLFALVFINSPEKNTLPLGLASVSMQAQYKTDFGLMFAGLTIIIIPTLLVYALLQRQLTRGITVGALKG